VLVLNILSYDIELKIRDKYRVKIRATSFNEQIYIKFSNYALRSANFLECEKLIGVKGVKALMADKANLGFNFEQKSLKIWIFRKKALTLWSIFQKSNNFNLTQS
jgi:hypothetical protein